MRGGTRKVSDSKPDVTSPTGDSIPMTFIGMCFFCENYFFNYFEFLHQNCDHSQVGFQFDCNHFMVLKVMFLC